MTLASALALALVAVIALMARARAAESDSDYSPIPDSSDEYTSFRAAPTCLYLDAQSACAVAEALATVAQNMTSIEQTPVSLPKLHGARKPPLCAIPVGSIFTSLTIDRICASGLSSMEDLNAILANKRYVSD